MKVLVVHPQGNENVRSVLNGLDKSQALEKYITGLGFSEDSYWYRLLTKSIQSQLQRRSYPLRTDQIESHPVKEIMKLIQDRGLKKIFYSLVGTWSSTDSCWNYIDSMGANYIEKFGDNLSHVYAYEDAAMESFLEAKKKTSDVSMIYPLVTI